MSKKELAAALYATLVQEGVTDKDMRKTFIARAQLAPMSMTAAGASTYYVNSKNAASGAEPKSYYKPASEKKVSQAVDDSKEDAPIWAVVVVDGLKKAGSEFHGKVDQAHGFMSQESAVARFNKLNPALRARCVVVEGDPAEGAELNTCKVIAH